jgi:integrase/recombinase XerC
VEKTKHYNGCDNSCQQQLTLEFHAPPVLFSRTCPAHRRRDWSTSFAFVASVLIGDRVTISDALTIVCSHFAAQYLKPATERKYRQNAERFARHLEAHGIEFVDEVTEQVVLDFLWSGRWRHGSIIDVSPTTASTCRSMTIAFFNVLISLGVWEHLPPVGPAIQRDCADGSVPLTGEQLLRVEQAVSGSLFASRASFLVALSEAGADAGEVAATTWGDINLDDGTVSFNLDSPRTNPLTPWGIEVLSAASRNGFDPEQRLCVQNTTSIRRGAQSVTVGLSNLLRDAGLGRVPGVTAKSIRLGIAQQVLHTDGLEAAARFLGSRSLDSTAASLHYEWSVQ